MEAKAELLTAPQLKTILGRHFANQSCNNIIRKFLRLASHENPGLRIIEFGAGTEDTALQPLSILQEIEMTNGVTSYSASTFTDPSSSVIELVMEKVKNRDDRLTCQCLDLGNIMEEQVLNQERCDLLIASNNFHTASDIQGVLMNADKLLKPAGYLIISGITPAQLPVEQWSLQFQAPGFYATAPELGDSQVEACQLSHLLILRKTPSLEHQSANQKKNEIDKTVTPTASVPRIAFIIDDHINYHNMLVDCFLRRSAQTGVLVETFLLPDVMKEDDNDRLLQVAGDSDTILVSLLEIEKPFVATISENNFYCLQRLARRFRNLLWVTSTTHASSISPYFSLVSGFLRTLRSEDQGKRIVTLAIESLAPLDGSSHSEQHALNQMANQISSVLRQSFALGNFPSTPSPELEYIVREGFLYTGRLVERVAAGQRLRSLTSPTMKSESWSHGAPLHLVVGIPGALDTMHFAQDSTEAKDMQLGPHEVEIETKFWPLSFRDLFVALGRLEYDILGLECAGVVTRVGTLAEAAGAFGTSGTRLQPGDRVCCPTKGGMRTYVREHDDFVSKIPDLLPLDVAASVINPGTTTYHGLINLARIKKTDRILIHSAAGSTGQMAVYARTQLQ